jgi:error-prone DNA polymerase
MTPAYAELQTTSNFSFLRGASHPEELVVTAAALGLSAIALTDRNSLAGIVRAHVAAKEAHLRFVVGARIDLEDGPSLLLYPTDRAAYGRLSQLITQGRRRAPKGECRLGLADLPEAAPGMLAVILESEKYINNINLLKCLFKQSLYIAASWSYRGDERSRIERLASLAAGAGLPLLATNDVHAHSPRRRPLQDVLTCIREHCSIETAGYRLFANAERHLKPPEEMARLFARYPAALAASAEIVARTRFSLDELRYEYPIENEDPDALLARRTEAGARERYPEGVPAKVRAQIDHELALIRQLGYAPYFLTVDDIVRFARGRAILCQGRGSAANSAVCFCLGVTSVDPAKIDLLFERFVSAERNEPPDIDVDFEHERREEVIQHIYEKYGRERAGLAATVIRYRSRSAIRDVGKAMGLSEDTVSALAGGLWGWSREGLDEAWVRGLGLDPTDRRLALALELAAELRGFPRHLSQHVGGFVITRGRLDALCPIENAAMADRTVIEWDKDDIDALGILKIDVLALGMLTCIRKAFDLIAACHGRRFDLASVPADDPAVYDMLCRADSIGVFQVESRAQMTMLPRLKPRNFYDLVIEVAIVRPGPIQGDMVHPYLRRRNGEESVAFPSAELEAVLGKTLGVPLFQEQAMKIAIVAAGFTPGEADRLRRAMATFRKTGLIGGFRDKMVEGMVARGYERDFAERCFRQIEGFGEYGFPESHAASFALLVYVSAWLKCRYPDAFAAALLNSQPMGFYAPAQILKDAADHGVELRPVDVGLSAWDATLEAPNALRVGLRQIVGLSEEDAGRLVANRGAGYRDIDDLWRRAGVGPTVIDRLARADALRSLGLARRPARWAARALPPAPLPLFERAPEAEFAGEAPARLAPMSLGAEVVEDYATLRHSLKAHPLALMRQDLAARGLIDAAALQRTRHGAFVRLAGLVLVRQRPGTAKGVIFVTLEDETGVANLIVFPDMFARYRRTVLAASLMGAAGRVERQGLVIHIKAERLHDMSERLHRLAAERSADGPAPAPRESGFRSRDFQ